MIVILPSSKWTQFGEDGLIVKGIIVHNTGNSWSAKENYEYLFNTTLSNGCHYLVDNIETIQCLPDTWKVWTTAKGSDWAFHNCLSIEICNMLADEDWQQSEQRAIALIKEWLLKYDLTKDDIYFHNDFNSSYYCPNKILEIYTSKKNWIERNFE